MKFLTPITSLFALSSLMVLAAGDNQEAGSGSGLKIIAQYRMGEEDGKIQDGDKVQSAIKDSAKQGAGDMEVSREAPVYSSDVPPAAKLRLAVSVHSLDFTSPANAACVISVRTPLITVTDNFGFEAWVKPNGKDLAVPINIGNQLNGMCCLIGADGMWAPQFAGKWGPSGGVSVEPGQWSHVALVRENENTTLYINGKASIAGRIAPNPATDWTVIGAVNSHGGQHFDGKIDEVRFFTFQPGAFNPRELNFKQE